LQLEALAVPMGISERLTPAGEDHGLPFDRGLGMAFVGYSYEVLHEIAYYIYIYTYI